MNTLNGKTISPQLKLQISPCCLEGVKVVTPPTIFEDFRGTYVETYNEDLYGKMGIEEHFVQDDISWGSGDLEAGVLLVGKILFGRGELGSHVSTVSTVGILYLVGSKSTTSLDST